MIVKQYIKEFEKLGFGMFVHFGLYSMAGRGEWAERLCPIPKEEYQALAEEFNPKPDWAKELVQTAKQAGCKYITLTTRHHDGFSLYDTCGMNTYDAVHAKCGRDLVREFVDECRKEDIIPFFYHTLIDWHEQSFWDDFPTYLQYLRDSVEIICKNYGKIGGIWFDGMWGEPNDDWEEDKLYGLIRKYQPEAMIINNTGLDKLGELGHIELDSVTFERGKPFPINQEGAKKYIASEMCEAFRDHWGYTEWDLDYKSPAKMIEELADCRGAGSNMLMNVGPKGDGSIPDMDAAILKVMGQWVSVYDEAIRVPRPSGIEIAGKDRDFILKDGKNYYLFVYGLPMKSDKNVALYTAQEFVEHFEFPDDIQSFTWMDDGTDVDYTKEHQSVTVRPMPFTYGKSLVVRVAKIVTE